LLVQRYLGHLPQLSQEAERASEVWNSLQKTLSDPAVGFRLMDERAQDNLRRYKAKQPLVGHLLPYLTAEEAAREGLNFNKKRGWIDAA
jgi:hypothetical protein